MLPTTQLVRNFISSLESHPNGREIIPIIQEILGKGELITDSSLIRDLKRLSKNNLALIEELWILRALIFQEEGNLVKMWEVLEDCASWVPNNHKRIEKVVQILIDSDYYLKALFLLHKTGLSEKIEYQIDYKLIKERLIQGLSLPTGIIAKEAIQCDIGSIEGMKEGVNGQKKISNAVLKEKRFSTFHEKERKEEKRKTYQIPPKAMNTWLQAKECYEEGIGQDNVTYLQAFIHFAHSTIRETLGLNGRFKAGLEEKIAQFGLYDYKRFLFELNRVRNAVMHENYLISRDEAIRIHKTIEKILKELER